MITQPRSFGARAAQFILPVVIAAFGCSDPVDTDIQEAFLGDWISTSFVVDGLELMTPPSDFYLSWGFYSDGSYQLIAGVDDIGFICDLGTSCRDDGDFTFTGNVITLDPGTADEFGFQYSVSGNTLTVSGSVDGTPFSATFERN